jgi:hypothetical protein
MNSELVLDLLGLGLELLSLDLSIRSSLLSGLVGLVLLHNSFVLGPDETSIDRIERLLCGLHRSIYSIADLLDQGIESALSDNVTDANFMQKSWASGGELGFGETVHAKVGTETGIRPGEVLCGSVCRIGVPISDY